MLVVVKVVVVVIVYAMLAVVKVMLVCMQCFHAPLSLMLACQNGGRQSPKLQLAQRRLERGGI